MFFYLGFFKNDKPSKKGILFSNDFTFFVLEELTENTVEIEVFYVRENISIISKLSEDNKYDSDLTMWINLND